MAPYCNQELTHLRHERKQLFHNVQQQPFEDSARLRRVRKYVDEHYGEPIDLETAAGVAAMESTAFSRFFSQSVGVPYCDWLARVRLNNALSLMASSEERTITDIAFDVGFGNLRSFQRLFKRHLGSTPETVRRCLASHSQKSASNDGHIENNNV